MICATCEEPIAHEVGNRHYGLAQTRCGCGINRAVEPVVPDTPGCLAHLPESDEGYGPSTGPATIVDHRKRDRKKGYTVGHGKTRWFYGTCKACETEFECRHPRTTCGKPECITAMATLHDPMMEKECPSCHITFKTRKAKPRRVCLRCKRKERVR